jgi:hypothetical protein
MTDDEAFKILAVENLAGFGWSITVDEIVDMSGNPFRPVQGNAPERLEQSQQRERTRA